MDNNNQQGSLSLVASFFAADFIRHTPQSARVIFSLTPNNQVSYASAMVVRRDNLPVPRYFNTVIERSDDASIYRTQPVESSYDVFKKFLEINNCYYSTSSLQKLLNFYYHTTRCQRDPIEVLQAHLQPIYEFFQSNPSQLQWAEDIASFALEGCVNQTTIGWLEIVAWVGIHTSTGLKQLESLKFLYAIYYVREYVCSDKELTSLFQPEAMLILLRCIFRCRNHNNELSSSWHNIPQKIAYEHSYNQSYQEWIERHNNNNWCYRAAVHVNELSIEDLEFFLHATHYRHIISEYQPSRDYLIKKQQIQDNTLFFQYALNLIEGDDTLENLQEQMNDHAQYARFLLFLKELNNKGINTAEGLGDKKSQAEVILNRELDDLVSLSINHYIETLKNSLKESKISTYKL